MGQRFRCLQTDKNPKQGLKTCCFMINKSKGDAHHILMFSFAFALFYYIRHCESDDAGTNRLWSRCPKECMLLNKTASGHFSSIVDENKVVVHLSLTHPTLTYRCTRLSSMLCLEVCSHMLYIPSLHGKRAKVTHFKQGGKKKHLKSPCKQSWCKQQMNVSICDCTLL